MKGLGGMIPKFGISNRFYTTESPNATETTKHYLQLFTPEPSKCYYYCLNNNYIKWGHLYNTDFLYKNIVHKQQYLVGNFQTWLHQTSWDNLCSYMLIIMLIYYSDISSSSVGITLFEDCYNTNMSVCWRVKRTTATNSLSFLITWYSFFFQQFTVSYTVKKYSFLRNVNNNITIIKACVITGGEGILQ